MVAESYYIDSSKPKAWLSLGEQHGVLKAVCETLDIPLFYISPKQHKLNLCRQEYATKEDTQRALKRLGYSNFETNDVSDAIAILITHCAKEKIIIQHPKSLKRV